MTGCAAEKRARRGWPARSRRGGRRGRRPRGAVTRRRRPRPRQCSYGRAPARASGLPRRPRGRPRPRRSLRSCAQFGRAAVDAHLRGPGRGQRWRRRRRPAAVAATTPIGLRGGAGAPVSWLKVVLPTAGTRDWRRRSGGRRREARTGARTGAARRPPAAGLRQQADAPPGTRSMAASATTTIAAGVCGAGGDDVHPAAADEHRVRVRQAVEGRGRRRPSPRRRRHRARQRWHGCGRRTLRHAPPRPPPRRTVRTRCPPSPSPRRCPTPGSPGRGPSFAKASARTSDLVIIESRCANSDSPSAHVPGTPPKPAIQPRSEASRDSSRQSKTCGSANAEWAAACELSVAIL